MERLGNGEDGENESPPTPEINDSQEALPTNAELMQEVSRIRPLSRTTKLFFGLLITSPLLYAINAIATKNETIAFTTFILTGVGGLGAVANSYRRGYNLTWSQIWDGISRLPKGEK